MECTKENIKTFMQESGDFGKTTIQKDVGLTHIKVKMRENKLIISHNGNMGNNLDDIDENLQLIGFPTLDELKSSFDLRYEEGHPDYMYTLIMKMT